VCNNVICLQLSSRINVHQNFPFPFYSLCYVYHIYYLFFPFSCGYSSFLNSLSLFCFNWNLFPDSTFVSFFFLFLSSFPLISWMYLSFGNFEKKYVLCFRGNLVLDYSVSRWQAAWQETVRDEHVPLCTTNKTV
jgi:hypothetical protein